MSKAIFVALIGLVAMTQILIAVGTPDWMVFITGGVLGLLLGPVVGWWEMRKPADWHKDMLTERRVSDVLDEKDSER